MDCPLPLPCGAMPAILVVLIFRECTGANTLPEVREPQKETVITIR